MTEDPKILVADDDTDVLEALRLLLKGEDCEVETATSPADVLRCVESYDLDAVLLDLNYTQDTTSGREGMMLLTKLRALDGTLPVIVMTAWGSVEGAVEAVRLGARDYIEKPWDNERLLATLRSQIELARALRKSDRLEAENRLLRKDGLPEFIAESSAMQPVRRLMEQIGPSTANVLITGEHGTGKEVVARWLHASSPRASKPLVPVNAGGLSEGVFESEFFGHVKGAFTGATSDRAGYFELADGGTLFLDEIANLPGKQQAKLLRVLQEGEFQRVGSSKTRRADVRVISATNADISTAVTEDGFREDLLYRLNTVEIALPPLRERPEDIPLLASLFLRKRVEADGRKVAGFTEDAMRALLDHSWPGNVRELEHTVERAVLLTRGDRVPADALGLRPGPDQSPRLDDMTLDEAECLLIRKALARADGNVSRAADSLGLSRSALYRRLEKHDLQ